MVAVTRIADRSPVAMEQNPSDIHLLVFPLDVDVAKPFIDVCNALDIHVTGASSAMRSAAGRNVNEFVSLPFITDPAFIAALDSLLETAAITHIYAPHTGVWTLLQQLKSGSPDKYHFHLCSPSPYQADWLQFAPSYEWAELQKKETFVEQLNLEPVGDQPQEYRAPLTQGQYAALHKQFIRIPGQCDEDKLSAFAHIARILPQGDLVEIGSLSGRSAFAIAWLANRYGIGNLISIDPWCNEKTEDQGEGAAILNSELEQDTAIIDFDKVFMGYIASVSLLNNVGYIRDISARAVNQYREAIAAGSLTTPELGNISVTGHISLLHIDGNHRYDHVCTDIATWEPFVQPGGWMLLDDYVWAFGDGPKRAGDELLAAGRFDVAFTMSDTLFLRKKS